jgi:three-Cys-motif partner protein
MVQATSEKLENGEQVKIKNKIFLNFLEKWFVILGKASPHLHYIDGMSGSGAYSDEQGQTCFSLAVQVILNYEKKHAINGTKVKFTLIDSQADNLENAKMILKKKQVRAEPHFIKGQFDQVIGDILKNTSQTTPTFILVEPFTHESIEIATIKKVMERDKTEVALTFTSTQINEFLSRSEAESLFQKALGSKEWSSLTNLAGFEREKCFAALYRNQLKLLASIKYVYYYPIEITSQPGKYFYLFHLSNHWLSCVIMKAALAESNFNYLKQPTTKVSQPLPKSFPAFLKTSLKNYFLKRGERRLTAPFEPFINGNVKLNIIEERIVYYLVRELGNGRPLSAILNDPYIKNRLSEDEVQNIIENYEILTAVEEISQVFRRDYIH